VLSTGIGESGSGIASNPVLALDRNMILALSA